MIDSSGGLAQIEPCVGSIIVLGSTPGKIIRRIVTDVMNEVANKTKRIQMPYVTSALQGRNICLSLPECQETLSRVLVSDMAVWSTSATNIGQYLYRCFAVYSIPNN